MIVLDTNVLSELMRAQPNEAVLGWLDSQIAHDVRTTAVTVAEPAVWD
jgi:toxin FitB